MHAAQTLTVTAPISTSDVVIAAADYTMRSVSVVTAAADFTMSSVVMSTAEAVKHCWLGTASSQEAGLHRVSLRSRHIHTSAN